MIKAAWQQSVRVWACAVLAWLTWAAAPLSADSLASTGQLVIVPTEGGYEISAVIEGRETATIEGSLTVLKDDTSGRMKTRQSRTIEATADQSFEVARTRVSFSDEGRIEATLVLTGKAGPFFRTRHLITREAIE